MYIAMNRFLIAAGKEAEFIQIWKTRDTQLDSVPGFREFHLLQGVTEDDHTLFSSHSIWESEQDFIAWTRSEAFRKAHANAGDSKNIYLAPPKFEGFNVVV